MIKQLNVFVVVMFVLLFVAGCKKYEPAYSAEKESALIQTWLDTMVKNKQDIDTTSTGLYYIVDKAGTGRTVQIGDTVTVQYTGMFLNGDVFDASSGYTYIHKSADQKMIQGWEEGIEVLRKGGSAVFLVPSAKGYGPYGYATIPPYTPLLFVIEVINIK